MISFCRIQRQKAKRIEENKEKKSKDKIDKKEQLEYFGFMCHEIINIIINVNTVKECTGQQYEREQRVRRYTVKVKDKDKGK